MDIPTLRRYLDDPAAAAPWLRSLGRGGPEAGARGAGPSGLDPPDARPAGDHLRATRAALEPLRRPRYGAEQPRAIRRRRAQPALDGHALRARPDGLADARADFLDQLSTSATCWSSIRRSSISCGSPRGRPWRGKCSSKTSSPRSGRWITTRWCCGRCGDSSGAKPCGSPTATSSANKACTP